MKDILFHNGEWKDMTPSVISFLSPLNCPLLIPKEPDSFDKSDWDGIFTSLLSRFGEDQYPCTLFKMVRNTGVEKLPDMLVEVLQKNCKWMRLTEKKAVVSEVADATFSTAAVQMVKASVSSKHTVSSAGDWKSVKKEIRDRFLAAIDEIPVEDEETRSAAMETATSKIVPSFARQLATDTFATGLRVGKETYIKHQHKMRYLNRQLHSWKREWGKAKTLLLSGRRSTGTKEQAEKNLQMRMRRKSAIKCVQLTKNGCRLKLNDCVVISGGCPVKIESVKEGADNKR